MADPAKTPAVLGIAVLGLSRLGFAPRDSAPIFGVGASGGRYAFIEDRSYVATYDEEADMAGILNLTIEQGATFTHRITYQDVYGTQVDLRPVNLLLQVRKAKSTTAEHVVSIASYPLEPGNESLPWYVGISTYIDEQIGKIQIDLAPSETETLEAGEWWYQLVGKWPSGDVRRIVEGRMTIDAQVAVP